MNGSQQGGKPSAKQSGLATVDEGQSSFHAGNQGNVTQENTQGVSCIVFNKNVAAPSKYKIHINQILQGLTLGTVATCLAIIKMMKPNIWSTVAFSVLTLPVGTLLVYLYRKQKQAKVESMRKINIDLGVKGLRDLLGFLPTWVSFTDEDKAEWMNKLLEELWPYYDKAICEAVKEQVEPIMEQFRPPLIIKRIGFKQLTFGDAPFRVESARVDAHDAQQVEIEMDIRWAGQASIIFAIEPYGGDATKICPKLTDLTLSARLRIILKPLVPVIPCFGAALVSLKGPPVMKYRLDFGKLGGSALGGPIASWLDGFIKSTLTEMVVWPRRYIVPMVDDPALVGPLEELEERTVGLLKVVVHSARDVPKMDIGGKADPMVVMYTGALNKVETTVKKKTLEPEWEETFYMTVEEPKDQYVRVEMYDVDAVNVGELAKSLNVIKNIKDTFGAREFIGRAMVPISQVAKQPAVEHKLAVDLGVGDYGALEGPGKGRGILSMTLVYRPLDMLDPTRADKGMCFVTVYRCNNLQGSEGGGLADPYCTITIKGKETFKTDTVYKDVNPEFNKTFAFYDVTIGEDVAIKVLDYDTMGLHEELGKVKIPIYEAAEHSLDGIAGVVRKDFPLGEDDVGTVNVKMRFVPCY